MMSGSEARASGTEWSFVEYILPTYEHKRKQVSPQDFAKNDQGTRDVSPEADDDPKKLGI